MTPPTRPTLVLANPLCLAKHGLDAAAVEALLACEGLPAEVVPLPEGPALGAIAERLAHSAPERVVAAGGDGTLHQVVNMLAGAESALGLLPLGTANDFARTLGLPLELEAAARVIAGDRRRAIDVGEVNGHRFLNAAHLGLGVETARQTMPALKRLVGPVAYLIAAGMAWRHARPIDMTIEAPDRRLAMPAVQLLVGHGRYFGGGFQIGPEATLEDGLFDVHLLDWPLSFLEAMSWAMALKRGVLRQARGSQHFRAEWLEVALSRPVEVNLDGELYALGDRLSFRLHRQALSVLA